MNFIQGNGFVAAVTRSSRRTTAVIKIRHGKVSVIVPDRFPMARIESLVLDKSRWIKEKLAIQNDIIAIKPKQFVSGESFSLLGQEHVLKVESGSYPAIRLHQGELVVSVKDKIANDSLKIRAQLIKWYKQQAEAELTERTGRLADIIGVKPTSVNIKSFKSSWGNCSVAGGINYNWKLVIAPERIVDYVVIHELCHILHHNHSPAFWRAVVKHCHDYPERRAWLKINGGRLEI
ncbi:MAG: SprT family zinc-dependent metalloprotease [Methylococcales bacterium]|nr:SprT family zinc-dependent metalloprotease [Methylococcales bacterium]